MNSPWYLVPGKTRERTQAVRKRLVCFGHAGGSPSAFHRWVEHVPPDIELRAAQLPGRGMRLREPAFRRLDDLVEAIAPEVIDATAPYALFGHSLGATLAFLVAHEARRRGLPAPARVFVSCRPAPTVPLDKPPIDHLDDDAFLRAIIDRYGEPDAGLRHPEIVQLLLPSLKADLQMLETWRYKGEAPLEVPLHVYGAERDTSVAREHLERWREVAGGEFTLEWLPGEHFHYMTDPAPLVKAVLQRLG